MQNEFFQPSVNNVNARLPANPQSGGELVLFSHLDLRLHEHSNQRPVPIGELVATQIDALYSLALIDCFDQYLKLLLVAFEIHPIEPQFFQGL